VLIRDLAAEYRAHKQEKSDPLPALPVQYADYAQWQREALTADWLRPRLQFWREQLHAASAVLELPTDRPRPPVQSYRARRSASILGQI